MLSLQVTNRWHLWRFQADTLQWTGNSEDSDKASAAQAGGGIKKKKKKGGEKEEGNTPSERLRRLADALSDSEVRGDDRIDGFYFQVVAGERGGKKKGLEELVMRRDAINQRSVFAANENRQ